MFWLPDDPLRFAVLVLMGTALVISSMVGGYKAAPYVGVSADIGAGVGILTAVAGIVGWFTS